MDLFVTKSRWLVGVPLLTTLSLSCGGSKKNSDPEDEKGNNPSGNSPSGPGVSTNAANNLKLSGQLALEGLSLNADQKRSLVMFTLDNTGQVTSKKDVTVEADGKFSTEIGRNRLEQIESAMSETRVDRDKLRQIFPEFGSQIDGASDDELREGLGEEIRKLKENPNLRYVLVSYIKSGNPEAEAGSMQFIGLPTKGANLKMLPGESLKGDTNLGKIVGSGDEASSELKAADSLNLSESVLEELGSASKTLKILKNDWMNPDRKARITPWFGFARSNLELTVNQFTPPDDVTIAGGGYYMGIQDIGAAFGEVCPPNPSNPNDTSGNAYAATPGKKVSWHPPVDIQTGNPPSSFGPSNPYTNLASQYSRQEQYEEISCSISGNSSGMYSRAKSDSDKEYQLQLGAMFTGSSPEGLWRMKVDDVEVGRWDLAAAAPYDKDGKPVIYVPAIKVITDSAGTATGFEAKFYYYDKPAGKFREVSDTAGLKKLLHSFNMDGTYAQSRAGGDLSVDQEDLSFTDGIVRGSLKPGDQALYPCPDDSGSVQCIRGFGFSYLIGAISYRMSLNTNGSP